MPKAENAAVCLLNLQVSKAVGADERAVWTLPPLHAWHA